MVSTYLKEYRWSDMQQMLANNRAVQRTSSIAMHGQLCVLTGATSGVGWAAAHALAAHGAAILMLNRDRERSERACSEIRAAYGVDCGYLLADFSSLRQVHTLAGQVMDACPRIDVLINNVGMHATTRTQTADGIETVFCVNHLASFILTYRLLDTLKRAPAARIIQVNSQGHRFAGVDCDDLAWQRRWYSGLRSYGASKTAQLLTVWEFADRLAGSGVTINAMHPGAVRSGIGGNNGPLYRWFKQTVLSRSLADPVISGQAIHYLATAPELAGISGQYFNLTHPEKPAPHALDRVVGRRVWDISIAMSGLASSP
jgi:NAD(P)-dependent dehydrogenase (short-subunit alcohol dehydrogenase family)